MEEIAFEQVTKQFASKKALDEVSLTFRTGRIYALLGENGAGKSTLAALLGGRYEPTCGRMLIDGRDCVFRSPHDAAAAGIAMVHQRPLIADGLRVWENIVLGAEPVSRPAFAGILNKRSALEEISKLKSRFEISVPLDPDSSASDLTADAVFYTALLAALFRKPRMLILDEPSASLDDISRNLLYACLSAEAERGTGIIVITHNLQEALVHADTIVVLKKGRLAALADNSKRSAVPSDILPHMAVSARPEFVSDVRSASLRRSLSAPDAARSAVCVFEAAHVSARPRSGAALFDVSFSVYAGGITVITGQRESGMETLENCITGMRRIRCSGLYSLGGNTFQFKKKRLTPALLRRFGTGIIPFDRTFGASNPALSVAQVAGVYEAPAAMTSFAEKRIAETGIAITPSESAANLSGGMLQRLILARELYYKPWLLILSEPFQGLDSASSEALAGLLHSVCLSGTAVLVLTSDVSFLSAYEPDMYVLAGGNLRKGGPLL